MIAFKEVNRLRGRLICLDIGGSLLAWVAVLALAGNYEWRDHLARVALTAAALSLTTVTLLAAQRLYRAQLSFVRSVELGALARATALCAVVSVWVHSAAHLEPSFTARVAVLGAAASFLVLVCLRAAYSSWLRASRARGMFCRRVCIFGVNDEAEALVDLLHGQPELGYRVVAVLGDPAEWRSRGSDVPAIDPGGDAALAASQTGASGVLIAASAVGTSELDRLVRHFGAEDMHVQISTGLARVAHSRIRHSPLSHHVVFSVEPPRLSPWQHTIKRVIDIVGSSVALFVASPVILAAAIAIKLEDGGPITYRQHRVGRNGQLFKVIKLRTMVPNASAQLAALVRLNERNGPLFKLSYDPRVTRIGRFLRSTSIDELPQLWNVLRGEMSLVGPRPALPEEVAQFDVELLERASVQPGITGLWQVEARDSPSFDAYRRLDLFYVDNWSVMLDLTILAATMGVVVSRTIRSLRRGGAEVVGGPDREDPESVPATITPLISAHATDATAVGQ